MLALCAVAVAAAVFHMGYFRFDASSETLVVEGDEDLAVYEHVANVFGGDDFLFLTFSPTSQQPLTREGLAMLRRIVDDLHVVDGVAGTFSVLNAPLLRSPPVALEDLADGFRTVDSPDVDLDLARVELASSPVFRDLLINRAGDTTAIRIDLAPDEALAIATARREALKQQDARSGPEWQAAADEYRVARENYLQRREGIIADIREIQSRYQAIGTLHLGGVPMIAADMITYVKRDLSVFSGSVVALMVLALAVFFRQIRWVLLPLATAALGVVLTIGLLGYLDWQATVISSNFISLLGITTISLTIHLIVQYREFQHTRAELDRDELVFETMRTKFAPCFFTALTTIAAFGSLTVSGIVPVEDFGWMMCIGITLSFVATFSFFPAVLLMLDKGEVGETVGRINHFIRALGEFTRWRASVVLLIGVVMAAGAYFGIERVSLDNRFAEYFDEDTEIFRGMRFIDRELGGTIPFDVVLAFPPYEAIEEEDDFFFEDEEEADPYPERYWFNRAMLDSLEAVHRFLEEKPFVGKVLSLTSLEELASEFNGGEKLSNFEIFAVLGLVPDDLREELIRPYASPETGELRLSGRIVESGPAFDREEFRSEIVAFGVDSVTFPEDGVVVTGMMVLFNSMLQQLLSSQVNTLIYIVLAVFVMFLVLLRSLPYALVGLIPNSLAAASVIAGMGYFGIPLDMMTTTIAAICIGIGVDDTIHYLHRFRDEYARWGDARVAVSFCHASIGQALYFTSLTVIIGFSVLVFSNFVPTVMFGVWTAVAMALALLANLTLLPALLVVTHASRPPDPTARDTS
jgi:predicted RND superfamily exporter protein